MASRDVLSMNDSQMWTSWCTSDCLIFEDGDCKELEYDKKVESCVTKLQKEDILIYGICPSLDDFILLVCELCGLVIKPQCLKAHLNLRHSDVDFPCGDLWESNSQFPKAFVYDNSSSSSQSSSKPVSAQNARCGASRHSAKSSNNSSNSVSYQTNFSNSSKTERAKSAAKAKKNSAIAAPVVRVERMSQNLVKGSNSPLNSVGAVAEELPSREQPPPVIPKTVNSLSSTSGPGPGSRSLKESVSTTSMPIICHVSSRSTTILRRSPSPELPFDDVPSTSYVTSRDDGQVYGHKKKSSSKLRAALKERKQLVKDKECDSNKVCGVYKVDSGKLCTNSPLSCRDHIPYSRKKSSKGWLKPTVDNLVDHETTKDQKPCKAKLSSVNGSPTIVMASNHSTTDVKPPIIEYVSIIATPPKVTATTFASTTTNTAPIVTTVVPNVTTTTAADLISLSISSAVKSEPCIKSSPVKPTTITSISSIVKCPKPSIVKTVLQPDTYFPGMLLSVKSLSDCSESKMGSEPESDLLDPTDPPFINHHPRPSAVCTFGLRRLNNGMIVHGREFCTISKAFREAVFTKGVSNPHPVKKLCVETPVTVKVEPSELSDSVNIVCSEPVVSVSSMHSTATTTSDVITNIGQVTNVTSVIVHPSACAVTLSNLTKPVSVMTTSTMSHRLSPPKNTGTIKQPRERTSSMKSSTNRRKRTSSSVLNGTSISQVAPHSLSPPPIISTSTDSVLPIRPIPQPVAYHFAFEEPVGALSRFEASGQNSLPLPPDIIGNRIMPPYSGVPPSVMLKDRSFDAFNGQLPLHNFHSLTVDRPLQPSATGTLDLTIGASGLMSRQFSSLPEHSHMKYLCGPPPSSHLLRESRSSSSRNRLKPKTRISKNTVSSVTDSEIPDSVHESSLSNLLRMSGHGSNAEGISTNFPCPLPPLPTSLLLPSDSVSPQPLPISLSPFHNGLSSPPPLPLTLSPHYSPTAKSISGTISNNQPLNLSTQSRTSLRSPEPDFSPPSTSSNSNIIAGKGNIININSVIPSCLPEQSPNVTAGHSSFHLSLPMTLTSLGQGGISPISSDENESESIASESCTDAQMCLPKSRTPSKSESEMETVDSQSMQRPLLMPALSAMHKFLRLPSELLKKNGLSKQSSSFTYY